MPAGNLKEFFAYVRKQPNGLNYSSAAIGTSSHLTGELLVQVMGVKLNHVPYKGTGFALNALFTGEVQAAFLSTTTTSAQMKAGKLKALALLSDKRFPAVPDIPTSVEQGFPGLESYVWFGLYAPARVPRPLIDRVNRDVTDILRSTEARDASARAGRGGHADDARGVRAVPEKRDPEVGQGDQAGERDGQLTEGRGSKDSAPRGGRGPPTLFVGELTLGGAQAAETMSYGSLLHC